MKWLLRWLSGLLLGEWTKNVCKGHMSRSSENIYLFIFFLKTAKCAHMCGTD